MTHIIYTRMHTPQFKDKLSEVEAEVAAERASSSHISGDWIRRCGGVNVWEGGH